jgi:hypothetical protein
MLTYSHRDLTNTLENIINNIHYIKAAGIPRACEYAAMLCFINKTPENCDTKIIRQALTDLHSLGHFNYKTED